MSDEVRKVAHGPGYPLRIGERRFGRGALERVLRDRADVAIEGVLAVSVSPSVARGIDNARKGFVQHGAIVPQYAAGDVAPDAIASRPLTRVRLARFAITALSCCWAV